MSKQIKPTKEEFKDYVRIQMSGVTNMFDIRTVCELAWTDLNKEKCLYIMDHYEELMEEYDIQ